MVSPMGIKWLKLRGNQAVYTDYTARRDRGYLWYYSGMRILRKAALILGLVVIAVGAQELPAPVKILGKRLTPLWAQEYIGADLIKEELATLDTQKIDVAIFDLGFEEEHINLTEEIEVPEQLNGHRKVTAHHGTAVVNIFNGPFGITEQMNLMSLVRVYYESSYRSFWNKYLEQERIPKVVSNSVGWRSDEVPEVVEKAYRRGTLWFLASGNDHPQEVRKRERESKAILIGSFAPSGLTTMDTQLHESLLALAPANEELAAIDGNGETFFFGATSGATPMVAATVVNIASILPTLTREQLFKIVKKTNFPSAENKLGQTEMPGLFNGYKAFKVARRLVQLCPDKSASCVDQQLNDETIFEFEVNRVIACHEIIFKSKSKQDELLKEMRRGAFLGSKQQAKNLSCAYKLLGFPKNAEYFEFITDDTLDFAVIKKSASKGIKSGVRSLSYYRYTGDSAR